MQQLQILWTTIASSTVLLAAAPLVLSAEGAGGPAAWAVAAMGLVGPVLSAGWGRVVATETAGTARWVPRWALAEAGACCGIAHHVLGGALPVSLALGGIAVGMVLANVPRDGA